MMSSAFAIVTIQMMLVNGKTKEIGVMRAIGAKRKDILIIFLFQGLIIGAIGATAGTAAGLAYTIYAKETQMSWNNSIPLEVTIQWDKVIQTALTSFSLALIASLYPSYRATKLLPVEAMRTVCGIVVTENIEQKIELAKKLMKDVRVLSIFQAENVGVPTNLTRTDLEIIEKLIKDPQTKIEDLAKSTKLSSKTVTRALEKFQKNDAILFTLVYDPVKLSGYIPYAILVGIKDDFEKTLEKLEKKFSKSFLQKPFLAKNQIVLFMYSDDIFKLDYLTQKVRETDGVFTADLFIPKKITFPMKWVTDAMKVAKNSKKLHLVYQTH